MLGERSRAEWLDVRKGEEARRNVWREGPDNPIVLDEIRSGIRNVQTSPPGGRMVTKPNGGGGGITTGKGVFGEVMRIGKTWERTTQEGRRKKNPRGNTGGVWGVGGERNGEKRHMLISCGESK